MHNLLELITKQLKLHLHVCLFSPTVAMFKTEFFVCGVAPYGEQIVVLTYDEEGASTEVCIFEWKLALN